MCLRCLCKYCTQFGIQQVSKGGGRAPASTWGPAASECQEELNNATHLCLQRVYASKSTSKPHETPNITATVREKHLRSFYRRPMIENRSLSTVFFPTTVHGIRDWSSQRQGGVVGERDIDDQSSAMAMLRQPHANVVGA